jgi:hypothetical protein
MGNKLKSPIRGLFLTALLCMVACKPSNPFIHIPISGEIVIGNNEQIIVFDKPFKPTKQVNEICFEYVGNLKIDAIEKPPLFADSTPLIITNYLVDNYNEKHELSNISKNLPNTLCFTPKNYGEWLNVSKKEVTFIKLIVRSNRKIDVSKIEWNSFNAWDFK